MVQRDGNAREVVRVDRVMLAAIDVLAMMQALRRRVRVDHELRVFVLAESEDLCRVEAKPGSQAKQVRSRF